MTHGVMITLRRSANIFIYIWENETNGGKGKEREREGKERMNRRKGRKRRGKGREGRTDGRIMI